MVLSDSGIKNEIKYLDDIINGKENLPNEKCKIPWGLKSKVKSQDYSQEIMQEISDAMAKFLNLKTSVHVKVVNEKLKNAPANYDSLRDAEKVGLYSINYSNGLRTIKIIKKAVFGIDNVIAILAHENVHNFMHEHSIEYENTLDNERLTDLCSVYVGFGDLLYSGYKDIHISSKKEYDLFDTKILNTYMKIGYISLEHIQYAMYYTAIARNDIQFASKLSFFDRMDVRKKIKKAKKLENSKKVINCPKCSKLYRVPTMKNGKTISINCKNCNEQFFYNF